MDIKLLLETTRKNYAGMIARREGLVAELSEIEASLYKLQGAMQVLEDLSRQEENPNNPFFAPQVAGEWHGV